MTKVVIIGGGASGLIAGIFAAREGASVTILERNSTFGKKLLATGNGRCNLSNTEISADCYHSKKRAYISEILHGFSPEETLRFFSELGLLVTNRGGGLYPRSNQAASVLELLRIEASRQKIKMKTNAYVTEIRPTNGGFAVCTDSWEYPADAVILACGSAASNLPGSGTSGYAIAEKLGLKLISPLPALVPLVCEGADFSAWAGVRTEGTVTACAEGERLAADTGELQLTNYGVSGIPVFQISSVTVRALAEGKKVRLLLDFLPEFSEEDFRKMLEDRRKQMPERTEKECLTGVFPERLLPILLQKKDLVSAVKRFPLEVKKAHSLEAAQVCSGGISLEEINPSTMEAIRLPGLYLAGELLDADGRCGGYNLQWAWSTGALAGMHAGKERK